MQVVEVEELKDPLPDLVVVAVPEMELLHQQEQPEEMELLTQVQVAAAAAAALYMVELVDLA
jgi:hypothetical protein